MCSTSALSHEDTTTLLERLGHHDDGDRAEVEAEVVRRHLWLLDDLKPAYAYAARDISPAEFDQFGRAALLKAAKSFDNERDDFVPFATVVIITELRRSLRLRSATTEMGTTRG